MDLKNGNLHKCILNAVAVAVKTILDVITDVNKNNFSINVLQIY